jgi:hypothetical protein
MSLIYVLVIALFTYPLVGKGATSPRESIVDQARSSIGIREATGRNDGPMVDEILSSVGLEGTKSPWCAAFVVWVGDKALTRPFNPYPRTAWSPIMLEHPTWDRTRGGKPLQPADVFGIWFNSMGRVAHTGIVEKNEGEWIVTIEGNTNGGGSRDGDGVYRRRRLARNILGSSWL